MGELERVSCSMQHCRCDAQEELGGQACGPAAESLGPVQALGDHLPHCASMAASKRVNSSSNVPRCLKR